MYIKERTRTDTDQIHAHDSHVYAWIWSMNNDNDKCGIAWNKWVNGVSLNVMPCLLILLSVTNLRAPTLNDNLLKALHPRRS